MNCLRCGNTIKVIEGRCYSWQWQYKCTDCLFAWETTDNDILRYFQSKILKVPRGCLFVVSWEEI